MSEDVKCPGCGLFKKYWVKECKYCALIEAGEEITLLKKQVEMLMECVEWYASEWNQINPNKARETLEKVKEMLKIF